MRGSLRDHECTVDDVESVDDRVEDPDRERVDIVAGDRGGDPRSSDRDGDGVLREDEAKVDTSGRVGVCVCVGHERHGLVDAEPQLVDLVDAEPDVGRERGRDDAHGGGMAVGERQIEGDRFLDGSIVGRVSVDVGLSAHTRPNYIVRGPLPEELSAGCDITARTGLVTLHARLATTLSPVNDPVPPLAISPTDFGYDVSGEIDAHTAPMLASAIAESESDELALDLSGIEFIDSSGLRVLIETHRTRAAAGQALILRRPSTVVMQLFRIAGLDDYFTIAAAPA